MINLRFIEKDTILGKKKVLQYSVEKFSTGFNENTGEMCSDPYFEWIDVPLVKDESL